MKLELETNNMTSEDALALAIFLTELFGLPRDLTLATSAPRKGNTVPETSDGPEHAEGTAGGRDIPEQAGSGGPVAGEGARPRARRVAKPTAKFVLQNKKIGVSHECDTGRKGDVELARGTLENWFRDAETEEEIKNLADMAEQFVATCLTAKEQRAMARCIAEAVESIRPENPSEEVAADDVKPEAEALTLDAVKSEAKTLASAKGLPAVQTIMSQFDAASFKDLKERDYPAFLKAVRQKMGE